VYMLGKNETEKGAGVLEALGRPYGRGSRAVPGKIAWHGKTAICRFVESQNRVG